MDTSFHVAVAALAFSLPAYLGLAGGVSTYAGDAARLEASVRQQGEAIGDFKRAMERSAPRPPRTTVKPPGSAAPR